VNSVLYLANYIIRLSKLIELAHSLSITRGLSRPPLTRLSIRIFELADLMLMAWGKIQHLYK